MPYDELGLAEEGEIVDEFTTGKLERPRVPVGPDDVLGLEDEDEITDDFLEGDDGLRYPGEYRLPEVWEFDRPESAPRARY